jgi:hypothetical protein
MARGVRRRDDLGRWSSVRGCGRCKGPQVHDSLGRRQALPVSIEVWALLVHDGRFGFSSTAAASIATKRTQPETAETVPPANRTLSVRPSASTPSWGPVTTRSTSTSSVPTGPGSSTSSVGKSAPVWAPDRPGVRGPGGGHPPPRVDVAGPRQPPADRAPAARLPRPSGTDPRIAVLSDCRADRRGRRGDRTAPAHLLDRKARYEQVFV